MKKLSILQFNILGVDVILKNVRYMVNRNNTSITVHFQHTIFDNDMEKIQLLKLYCLKTNNGFSDDKENDLFCFQLPISCVINIVF